MLRKTGRCQGFSARCAHGHMVVSFATGSERWGFTGSERGGPGSITSLSHVQPEFVTHRPWFFFFGAREPGDRRERAAAYFFVSSSSSGGYRRPLASSRWPLQTVLVPSNKTWAKERNKSGRVRVLPLSHELPAVMDSRTTESATCSSRHAIAQI